MEKKVAVITGGTKGIGRALVERFLSEGFIVYSCARTEFENDLGSNFNFFKADLTNKSEVNAFGNYILSKSKKISTKHQAGIKKTPHCRGVFLIIQ